MDIELGHEARLVTINRLRADVQQRRDLFHTQSLPYARENLDLTPREFRDSACNLRSDGVGAAAGNEPFANLP